MRKTWVLAGAAVLVAVTAAAGVVVMSSAQHVSSADEEPPPNTVKVMKGQLSDVDPLVPAVTSARLARQ